MFIIVLMYCVSYMYMLGFEKKLLRNMFFQCHLRTEKWSDFYHIYNKYEIWGLPLVRKGPEPMPPPHTHTHATYPLSGIEHDEI